MKKLVFFLFLSLLVASCALFKKQRVIDKATSDMAELEQIITYLASDSLKGRLIASPGARKAGDFITKKMKGYGLKPLGKEKSYIQKFPYKRIEAHMAHRSKVQMDTLDTYGENIIGYHDNEAKYTVVIMAHFDHLGQGQVGFGVMNPSPGETFNGADNNASGVAAMLLLSKHVDSLPKGYNYLFVAFSGSEVGFKGATYFVRHPPIPLEQIAFGINLDAVGRMEGNQLTVYGTGTSPIWDNIITEDNAFDLLLDRQKTGISRSDQTLFFIVNLPALHLSTGKNYDTNKPTDDVELINYEGIEKVIDYTKYILKAAVPFQKPAFTATNEYKRKYADKFKVTLGIMPDYYFPTLGIRIEVVIPDRAADKAGLKDGDIIIKMGDVEVTSIYRYVDALSKYRKGDQATIVFKRDGKVMQTTATFE